MLQRHSSQSNDPFSTHETITDFAAMVGDFWTFYVIASYEGDQRGNDVEPLLRRVFETIVDNEGHPIRVIHSTETDLSGLRYAQVLLGPVTIGTADDVSIVFQQAGFDEGVYTVKWDPKHTSQYFRPFVAEHEGPDNWWHFESIGQEDQGPDPILTEPTNCEAHHPLAVVR